MCKFLSVFLTVLLMLQIAPMQLIADAYKESTIDENTENTLGVSLNDIETTEAGATILAEETSKREQYVKHFRMSDGSYRATQYEVPVHFIQDGEWTDYDNTLTEIDADTEDGESANSKDLINNLSDYYVRLSKKTNGKKFVRIEKDGYKLSWYYTKANKVTAQITEITDDGDETTLEKLFSRVLYEDVYINTNFEYIVGSDGLKENIILKNKDTKTVFEAEYKANGLTPVQIDDRTIELQANDGTVIYTVSAPYMTDANGEYSSGITLTLSSVKNNRFTVITTLDEDWLAAYDRAYPVTVDPIINTKQIAADMASAFVGSSYPDRIYYNYGQENKGIDSGSMYVGNISGYGQTQSYLKFSTLPALGIADKVINAVACVYMYKCENGMQMDIKRVTSLWAADTVTWNKRPTVASNITDYKYISDGANKETLDFEITDLVRGWYSGEYDNYGISFSTTKTSSAKVWMLNSLFNEGGLEEVRPILFVDYRNMSGYEDYWSYTGISAGRNGAVSVNNYNGNAVFAQPLTLGDGGNRMPVSLSLVYNSNGANAPFTRFGMNFQTNFHIYLKKEDNKELYDKGYRYYLNDADGTKHWFYFEKSDSTSGKDEDGLGYAIDIITVGSDKTCENARFRITDDSDSKMYFDEKGKLVQINDTNGNFIKISHVLEAGVYRMKTITDGAGRVYTFNHEHATNVRLCTSITDPSGREIKFTYSGEYLSKITFPDGETVSFGYTGGLVTQINGIDGTRAKINYESSSQKRVESINWGTSDTNLLESYSFNYLQNETTVTDKQARSYTYQFNDFGQTTGIVSNKDGKAQYFEYAKTESVKDSRANKLISESKVIHSVTNYVIDPGFSGTALNSAYTTYIKDISDNTSITLDTTKGNLTDNSVKIYKTANNTGAVYLMQNVKNLSAGEYTLSAYINTEGKTIANGGVYLGYNLYDADGNQIKAERAEKIFKTDGWERFSMSFKIEKGQYIKLHVGMQGDNQVAAYGTVWVDDIQVEKSTGMSSYNLLENSAFTNGITHWSSTATLKTISDLPGFTKAISKVGSPSSEWLGLSQYIYESGKKGDVFGIGAWVKADSAPINDLKKDDLYSPRFALALHFYDSSGNCLKSEELPLNDDVTSWQFVSGKVIAPVNYAKLCFEVIYYSNINTVMMTGGFCYKEEFGQTYTYDKDGHVVSAVDLSNSQSSFAYKGGQMAQMLNPSGSRYMYSYDDDTNNLNYALSSDGQQYAFEYDSKGNVTSSEITARKPETSLKTGTKYILVNAYSGKAFDSGNTGVLSDDVFTSSYDPNSQYQQWTLQAIDGVSNGYRIISVAFPQYWLDISMGYDTDGRWAQIYNPLPELTNQKFKITGNNDGTFTIYTASSRCKKALDAQYDSNDIEEKQIIKQNSLTNGEVKESMKWYFYPVEATEEKSISTSAAYTENQNFVSSMTDQRGNTTSYNYNETKGTLTSLTDVSGNTTNYNYDANTNALLSVSTGGMTNSYNYTDDRLTDINVNGATQYRFAYDRFGRTTGTLVGNGSVYRYLSQLVYNSNGLLSKQTYGNGDYISFEYDSLDRLIGKSYNGSSTDKVEYFYGADGNISKTIDYSTNTRTKYVYDLAGRLVSARDYKNGYSDHAGLKSYVEYTYADKTNYLTGIKHYNALGTQNIGYTYGNLANGEMPDQIYGVTWNGKQSLGYTYDGLGRLTNKALYVYGDDPYDETVDTEYTYVDVTGSDNKTTTLLKSISTEGVTHTYEYDERGNITSIYDGSEYNTYEYDELNQLVRENLGYENVTYTYEYENGNIKYKHKYAYTTGTLPQTPVKTTQYHYEDAVWGDVLTKITETTYGSRYSSKVSAYSLDNASDNTFVKSILGNSYNEVDLTSNAVVNVAENSGNAPLKASANSGNSSTNTLYNISSDEIGNIISIGNVTLDWNGRRLESISQAGTEIVSYDYNIDGQRIKKTALDLETGEPVTTEYFYNGSILAGQKTGDDVLIFMYDNNGDIFGFTYNGTPYYYIKNAQNDVFLILDENGRAVVLYQYDSWGKVTRGYDATDFNLASINPIMYRSYYVDLEMGMFVYYLNSRYYIADWGRFASADNTVSNVGGDILGYNMFAYCQNNPVNMSDADGNWPKWVTNVAKNVSNAVKKTVSTVVNKVKSFVSSNIKSSIAVSSLKSLPPTGDPNSSQTLPNPDGTPKQKRWYGPDGKAVRDRDYNHPGDVPFPHDHEWKNGERGTDHLDPSPDYKFSLETIIGVGIVVTCVVGIAVVIADDATGVGVADDFLFGPLGAGLTGGLTLIFE